MSEFLFSLVFCSFGGTILYQVGMRLLNRDKTGRGFREVYCFLHTYIAFMMVMLASVSIFLRYEQLRAGTTLLFVQTSRGEWIKWIVFFVWVVGGVKYAVTYARDSLWVSKSKGLCRIASEDIQDNAIKMAKLMKIWLKPKVHITEYLLSPELGGWIRPHIYLPQEGYSKEQLRCIFAHELTHYKNGDGFMRKACLIFYIAFWFYKPLRELIKKVSVWDEKYCDYRVYCSGLVSQKNYVNTILHVAKRIQEVRTKMSIRPHMYGMAGQESVKERVDFIVGLKNVKKANRLVAVLMVVGMVLVGGGATVAVAATVNALNEWDIKNSDMGYEENLEEITLIEYEMPGELIEGNDVDTPDVEIQASPNGVISTSLNNKIWKSGIFSAKSGQTITVGITSATPTSVTISAGIIEPDGTWRWVNGKGSFTHNFSLDQNGYYQVFVRNDTTTTVSIFGSYATYTAE